MKRSEINAALREMERMLQANRIALPPFCDFSPERWRELAAWGEGMVARFGQAVGALYYGIEGEKA